MLNISITARAPRTDLRAPEPAQGYAPAFARFVEKVAYFESVVKYIVHVIADIRVENCIQIWTEST
jgi:hypothetical protein